MKLIDAGELILDISKEIDTGLTICDVLETIKAQPAAMGWHKITRREPTQEEKDCTCILEGLPEMGEQVMVTDGETVWIDVFEEWDGVFLDIGNIDEVIAWMECPSPYKESTTECITDKRLGYSEIGLYR